MLSHEALCLLGEDLALPSAWRQLAVRATAAGDRRWLLQQVHRRLLVATPHGRARLRAWLDRERAAPSTPMPRWLLARWVRERVLFAGDAAMLEPVVAAFLHMPAPVRQFVLGECCFRAVGAETRAWIGSSRLIDREGRDRPQTIELSGAPHHVGHLVATVCHEAAHAWSEPRPSVLVSAQGEEGLRTYFAKEGLTERFNKKAALGDRLAEALATVWSAG